MKAADPPQPSLHNPLAPVQSHLSVEAAPYVRNPSPLEAAAEIPEDRGEEWREKTDADISPTVTATADVEHGAKDEFVEPGWKGWLNVVGSVAVNMICCE